MKHLARLTAATLLAASLVIPPAAAQDSEPVEVELIRDRDDVVLDPSATYLLVEAPAAIVSSFVFMPSDEERADWERQRQEELAEAIEDYPRDLSRYERDIEFWEATRRRRRDRPARPVEPTDETFPWPDLESRKIVTIGHLNRFAKSDEASLWLYEVPAGEYLFYGLGMIGFNDCACMGSVSFSVAEGSVTAVRVGYDILDPQGNLVTARPDDVDATDAATRTAIFIEEPSEAVFDPRIPRERIVTAEFSPVGRLANWFGGTVNRVQPIAGVIDYDRDRVIDVQAEAAAALAAAEAAAAAEAEAEAVAAAGEAALEQAAAEAQSAAEAELEAEEAPAG